MGNGNSRSRDQALDLLLQTLTALGIGILFFLLLVLSSITIFQLTYNGRIFPGVYIHDISVGGLTIDEAADHLTQHYQFSDSGYLTLKYVDESIFVEPGQLGIHLDAVSTAEEAYQFGRSFPLSKWVWQQALIFAPHIETTPVLIFNEQIAADLLQQIGGKRDQPLVEAGLEVNGTQVTATPGQIGYVLDMNASLFAINECLIKSNPGIIDLQVEQLYPLMLDANKFIPLAQAILDQSFIIETPEGEGLFKKMWTITPENLCLCLRSPVKRHPLLFHRSERSTC
jgi:hypothetical protein